MAAVTLECQERESFGKGSARQLRREGRVPAVVYGSEREGVSHISVDAHALMMALKIPQVILEVSVDGKTVTCAPRQVQRDPVRRTFEHVDLVELSAREVRERIVVGEAVAKAETVATENELDPVAVVTATRELLDEGLEPDEAIEKAVEQVKEQIAAQAAAAAAAAEAEAAKAAEAAAAEGEEGAAPADSADAGGDEAASEDES